jgi:hypothetical protein
MIWAWRILGPVVLVLACLYWLIMGDFSDLDSGRDA